MLRRHGPNLPYEVLAGLVPVSGGWLVASAKFQGPVFAPEAPRVLETLAAALDARPAFSVVALDAPVGSGEEGLLGHRSCDRLARELLGRDGSVPDGTFAGPPPGGPWAAGRLGPVPAALLARYGEVGAEMAPYRQRTVFEVHPELSLYQLNGLARLATSEHGPAGVAERRALLEERVPDAAGLLDAALDGVMGAELVAVTACLWTARRVASADRPAPAGGPEVGPRRPAGGARLLSRSAPGDCRILCAPPNGFASDWHAGY